MKGVKPWPRPGAEVVSLDEARLERETLLELAAVLHKLVADLENLIAYLTLS